LTIRLAELMAALSLATDFGMGQPIEFAMQSCVLAMRLAEKLGFDEKGLRAVYYQSLLRYIGCNAETRLIAAVFGDELALRKDILHADTARPEFLSRMTRYIRQANEGAPPLQMLQAIVGGLASAAQTANEFFTGHCEVAHRLAGRLGFEEDIVRAMGQVYARWDGKGIPSLKGEAIAPGMLVVSLAQDVVYIYRLSGANVEAAIEIAKKRRGGMYAPKHVEQFGKHARELFAGIDAEPSWDVVLALEPGPRKYLTETEFDSACAAVANYTDIKSPYLLGHSTGVAKLAEEAARRCGLPESDVVAIRRAGLLHDVGRVGVSAGIWGKPGSLSDREWEKVRLHPYHTERIFARPATLAKLGTRRTS
jgi:HD-GYP domain-containing protein (c-di-GMP phosphodiesterase class II)